MIEISVQLPKMCGLEIRPGVTLMDEPALVDGKLRCLANIHGELCVIELSIKLKGGEDTCK